jgi:hypothetical protein
MSFGIGMGLIFLVGGVLGLLAVLQLGGGKIAGVTAILGGGGGFSILSIFTDVWQFISACFTGALGIVGYLVLASILFLLGMFAFNALITATDNKKGNFSFWR